MAEFLDELKRYVGWTDDDSTRLRAIEPVLRPRFARFAEHFYEVIARHPRANAVFTGGDLQIARLKTSLVAWMTSGMVDPLDGAFHARRSRIGQRHVEVGLPQEYMFTAIDVLRLDYHAALAELVAPGELMPAVASVDKLFDIELAIMLRHYQLDSERKLVAGERRIQSEKLVALQTLTAGLAHEVRNPLNAAKLQLELLERRLRRSTDDPRLLDTTGLIAHEIARLTRLLNEFLSFARPPQLATTARDLVAIARQVLELESAKADGVGVALALVGDERPVMAAVDAGKIHQIVQNLVRNAIEATPPGGRVEVRLAESPTGVTIDVVDTGPGIPSAISARIFEPFFSTKAEGTGLGMAIVHSLVAAHGGTVELDTGLGRGARFTVTLPR